jgi:pimeloyl-ACP methyl ester carboxylesterase
MKYPCLAVVATAMLAGAAQACEPGVYMTDRDRFVAVTRAENGFAFTFSDGTVGKPGACSWPKLAARETATQFESHGVVLAGRLLEPQGAGQHTPLVVYAHGSEGSGWIERSPDPYQMLGRGISVFVYDKRGTGLSKGEYTQNFPLLADDLVAASREARRLAAGRHGRFGLLGLSQGGWIAPLAAQRAQVDFIGIGYGLAVDIAEEDAEQVAMELRERGFGDAVLARGREITDITARIVKSAFKDGLDELEAFQKLHGKEPWFAVIKGAYTGVFLTIPVDHVRKNGIPQFEKLGVDWSQKPLENLRKVNVPQLWAFAADDRQAPIAQTVERLERLRKEGKHIAMYTFPGAEHGMWQFEQAPDFSRRHTRIAPGFYDLMADWAKGKLAGAYGQSARH